MPIHFDTSDKDAPIGPQIKGKFFYVGGEKLYIRGVTYGTFRQDDSGNEFYNPDVVEKDFAQMAANGINVVRIYTAPPTWLLDIALQNMLW
jgi:beta-galactosidase/beta-glucuronidase